MLVFDGTPTVNGGITFPNYGRVNRVDVETVEGVVTPMSVETSIAIVAPIGVDTFKSPNGEVSCIGCACEEDCEDDEPARGIDLPLLKSIH